MSLNGHAKPLARLIESQARAIESQTLYGSLLLGAAGIDWTELGPDGRPLDPWVPSGARRRNQGEGEAQPVHFTEEQLHQIRARSRHLCATNEFAICGTANRQNYVIGKGLAYKAVALPGADAADPGVVRLVAMAQAVIDAFTDSCELPAVERECMGRLDRDGEYVLRLFPRPSGLLAVRRVEPEYVRPPDGWGGDPRYSYGVETAEGDVETPVAYWVRERPEVPGAGPTRVPAEDIVHDKINVDATSKRGVPTWYPVEANLLRAEDLLASMTSMAKTRAKIAAHRKLSQATQATARSLLDALTVASITDPGSQQTVSFEKMRYGSILTTGGNVEWEFPNAQVEADQFVAVLQAELRAIAARIQQPEWMLTADASNANMASTLVAEAPSTKGFEAIQHQFKRRFGEKKVSPGRSLIWRQIDYAVRCGILPRQVYQFVGVQCEPPSLVVRNRLAEAQTDKIYLETGVKSIPTIRMQQGLDGAQEDRGFETHPPQGKPDEPPEGDPAGLPQVTDAGGRRAQESERRAATQRAREAGGKFEEHKHPRAKDGKFGSGGGSAGSSDDDDDEEKERKKPAGPKAPKAAKPKADPAAVKAKLAAAMTGGGDHAELTESLMGLTVAQINAVKKDLGLSGSGTKADLARKVADAALAGSKGGGKVKAGGATATPAGLDAARDLIGRARQGKASLAELADGLAALKQADINALKKELGEKAGGKKVDQARKLADAVMAKAGAGPAQPPGPAAVEPPAAPAPAAGKAAGVELNHKDPSHPVAKAIAADADSNRIMADLVAQHGEAAGAYDRAVQAHADAQRATLDASRRHGWGSKEHMAAMDARSKAHRAIGEAEERRAAANARARQSLMKAMSPGTPLGVKPAWSPGSSPGPRQRKAAADGAAFINGLAERGSVETVDVAVTVSRSGRAYHSTQAEQKTSSLRFKRLLGMKDQVLTHEIALGEEGGRDQEAHTVSMVHELGHYLERQKGVVQKANAFVEYRCAGEEPADMGAYGMPGEKGRKDDFEKAFGTDGGAYYVGKVYDRGRGVVSTEVVSMGLEKLYSDPVGFMQNDPEYAQFVLGVLRDKGGAS
jgi:hypothetical protein